MRLQASILWKSLLCTGALSLILVGLPSSAEDAGALYNTLYDVAQGERYFERQCSRCHGFDAKGNDETGAPDLTGRLNRANNTVGIFNVVRNGVPNTAMLPVDSDLPDAQVWQVVSYIESLRYDPASVVLDGDADAGLALFRGNGDCTSCHMVNGQGGRLGPDLSRVGESTRPDDLMIAITNPHEDVAPRWWTLEITGADGITRSGFRMGEDSFSVRIMDNDANLWSYQKNDIESIERIERSTMPSYDGTMSESELDDLVAYLFSLRREEN
jgi:cytochrome c oxidase cbb3-type subunit III